MPAQNKERQKAGARSGAFSMHDNSTRFSRIGKHTGAFSYMTIKLSHNDVPEMMARRLTP
jgi:hypothetical protein